MRHKGRVLGALGSLGSLLAALAPLAMTPSASAAVASATVPSGFVEEKVADIAAPTSVTSLPDGRVLVTSQNGQIVVIKNGVRLATPALNIGGKICNGYERGLLGLAPDPNFAANGYLYGYYTLNRAGCGIQVPTPQLPVNRLVRWTMSGDTVSVASEVVLVDGIVNVRGFHNAGDVKIGPDGLIYVSSGDGGCDARTPTDTTKCGNSNLIAQQLNYLQGKVLRVARDGSIPAGNPYQGADSARCNNGPVGASLRCREILGSGFRNPFRLAVDVNAASARVVADDVGQGMWEEIDLLTGGANYGWPVREGNCSAGSATNCGTVAPYTNPVGVYQHNSEGCDSITGGAFVPNGLWSGYDGAYLTGDYVCGKIFRWSQTGSNWSRSVFASGLGAGGPVALAFAPVPGGGTALYYTTYGGPNGGELRRIRMSSGNRAPSAAVTASPTSGASPLVVQLDGSGSSDPDGDALQYRWTFGDGATQTTSAPTVSHTYTTNGARTATLVVADGKGGVSAAATVKISVGNQAPKLSIQVPWNGFVFTVGKAFVLKATATDAEDGAIPGAKITWAVHLHHDAHEHPYVPATAGSSISVVGPQPEDLAATTTSYLMVTASVTDSGGATTMVEKRIDARRVLVTFKALPSGLKLRVATVTITTPKTVTLWAGWKVPIQAYTQTAGGKRYVFKSWSDGKTATHDIVAAWNPVTFTATYRIG